VARPIEIAKQLKEQRHGQGHGALHEDHSRSHPKSKYDHRIPGDWMFSQARLDSI
jgi:hypothetical protein